MSRSFIVSSAVLGLAVAALAAQSAAPAEKIDAAINDKIRAEEMNRSQIMRIEHVLTDVYGPRLTGSPNHKAAGEWAVKEMTSWGMKNGGLEPFEWNGKEGWLNVRADGHVVAPYNANLQFAVQAWTPSTNGVVRAPAVNIVAPRGPEVPQDPNAAGGRGGGRGGPQFAGPTQAELDDYLAPLAARVKGAIVLVGAASVPPFVETEGQKRRDDAQVKAQYNPDPNAPPNQGRGNRGGGGGGRGQAPPDGRLTAQQVNTQITAFLKTNGAVLRATDANERLGIVRAQAGNGYDTKVNLPGVLLRNEDYGRIARVLADGTPVTLEFNIVNQTFPDGHTSYNAVAEIPGTDKADEVVMLGGHLDSWHSATGATDNAIGCAIMMEAARILQAIGAKPRRTIRVALWGGEEEGLLGSLAYVAKHFGTFEEPIEPAFSKLDAYWNIDSGTGRVRGAGVFGPPEGAQIVAQFLKPFEDLGVYGASAGNSRATGGTDSTSFNHAGLMGIGGGQDSIEYNTFTHHTILDTYERILPEDVKKDAIITASVVYHIAMRDQMMPRFTKDTMPALPPARGTGSGQ
jgi:carboxypeptidase Q